MKSPLAKASLVFIAAVVLVLVLRELQWFVRPFVVAVILTLLLAPYARWSRRKKIPLIISMGALFVVFVLLLVGLGKVISLQEVGTIDTVVIDQLQDRIQTTSIMGRELSTLVDAQAITRGVADVLKRILQVSTSIVTELLLIFIFLIFMMPTFDRFIEKVAGTAGRNEMDFVRVISRVEHSIRDYLVTKTIVSLGVGATSAFILWAFKSDYVVVWALVIFAFNYIPNIGSIVAVAMAVFAYFLKFGFGPSVIWLLIMLTATQIFHGNYLDPKMQGRKLKLSPILILLSLFFWGWVWGVIGAVLAIPLTNIIKIILENIPSTQRFARLME